MVHITFFHFAPSHPVLHLITVIYFNNYFVKIDSHHSFLLLYGFQTGLLSLSFSQLPETRHNIPSAPSLLPFCLTSYSYLILINV